MRTSTAHLALRAVLHPVLARPVVPRGILPLRALRRQLLSPCIRVLCIADIRNVYPDSRPPNRRRHTRPRGGRPEVMIRCCLSRVQKNNGAGARLDRQSGSACRWRSRTDLNACPIKSIPDRRVFIGRFVSSTNETLQFLHEFIPGSHQSKMRSRTFLLRVNIALALHSGKRAAPHTARVDTRVRSAGLDPLVCE